MTGQSSNKWGLKKCTIVVCSPIVLVVLVLYTFSYYDVIKLSKYAVPAVPKTVLPVFKDGYKQVDLHGIVSIIDKKKAISMQCNQCALVSSSGQMLNSNRGQEIDNTECVIRMNNAPTKGFEKDVGKRTTIRIIAHSAVTNVEKKKEELMSGYSKPSVVIMWGPYSTMRSDGYGGAYNFGKKYALKYDDIEFFMLTQGQMHRTDYTFEYETGKPREASGSWLSTGWFTITTVLNLCNNTKVYGMVDENHCRLHPKSTTPYHYYESKVRECHVYNSMEAARKDRHRFALEKKIFARWSPVYNITFHQPDWPISTP
ncbi:alpha-N-acetylgalactosaminide alpha-2,6-sialyltransferase 5-like [Glandiceps talaboti]